MKILMGIGVFIVSVLLVNLLMYFYRRIRYPYLYEIVEEGINYKTEGVYLDGGGFTVPCTYDPPLEIKYVIRRHETMTKNEIRAYKGEKRMKACYPFNVKEEDYAKKYNRKN